MKELNNDSRFNIHEIACLVTYDCVTKIKNCGFLDDSDGVNDIFCFISNYDFDTEDNLKESERNTIYDIVIKYLQANYNCILEVDHYGNFDRFYYSKELNFKNSEEFYNFFDLELY